MKSILELSQGNPGALTFLMELTQGDSLVHALPIASKLERCTSIKGTNLYVLWSDLCNKDMETAAKLCDKCPDDILEDACSRQDYSGRELVKEYLS